MKKIIVLLILALPLVNLSCEQPQSDPEKEKEAIIALIEEESQSYYDKDFERWSDFYVHSDDNIWILAQRNYHDYRDGWENMADNMKPAFETEKEINREVKKPIHVKVYGKSAWIVFESEQFDENNDSVVKQIATYFLEKQDDKWKIIYTNRVYDSTYYLADWAQLDMIQYAKSLGKSPEDIGKFWAEHAKKDWAAEMKYEDYQNTIVNNFRNNTPKDGFTILEEDENHVVFTSNGMFSNLKKSGTLNDVTYEEYLKLGETFWTQVGDHVGADFTKEITADGLKISLSKR